ncbi:MAG TPA: hypothetical protein VGH38_25655 [Bryobacteraceae bacterium]
MLLVAGSGIAAWGRLYATTGDFWDKKPPSEWDSEQIEKLMHKSPWAKEVTAQMAPGERDNSSGYPNGGGYPGGGGGGGGMGGPRVGMGIPGIGIGMPRGGMGGGGRRGNGGGRRSAGSYEKGTVRWESAQPIIDAQKTPLPEAFANHYVISVSGIPLRTGRRNDVQTDDDNRKSDDNRDRDDSLDNLKQFTILEPKGKELVQAGVVQRSSNAYSSFLFGFSKETLQLSKDDHEVSFSTKLGQLIVKAKFDLKMMTYHKKLAV